jgi:hypothetical protein
LDRAFEAFVWLKQPKREKDTLALAREASFIEVRLLKRKIGDAMRNQIDPLGRNLEDLLEDTRGVLAHNDKALRACGDPVHYNPLVKIRFTEHGMQSCNCRHLKVLKQLYDMTSGFTSKDSKFML